MGQFINSDCNTWKVSRPSPQCYFTAPHKSRRGSTTAVATTTIKINTAVANTIIGGGGGGGWEEGAEPSGQSAVNSCYSGALSVVYRQYYRKKLLLHLDLVCFLSRASSGTSAKGRGGLQGHHRWNMDVGQTRGFNIPPPEPTVSAAQPTDPDASANVDQSTNG